VNQEPVVDLLEEEWQALDDLYSGLTPDEWETPTELPGWTVRDLLSHVIGTERMLLGEKPPEVELADSAHLKNPIGRTNELWVQERRDRDGATVLDEFRSVTAERLRDLRAKTPDDFDADSFTPRGPGTYREFMEIRVMDCWMHEQDARRVLARPGHLGGPVVERSLDECERALGFVVAKKAGAPGGTGVLFDVAGAAPRQIAVAVTQTPEGKTRASVVDSLSEEPDVRLGFDTESFVALCGGRWDAAKSVAEGRVTVDGNDALADAILDNIAFMI